VVAGVAGTLEDARGVWQVELKMSASSVNACWWASPTTANGAAGAGCSSAWVSAAAASRVASTEEVVGMVGWCGKDSTVLVGGVDVVTAVLFSGRAKIPSVESMGAQVLRVEDFSWMRIFMPGEASGVLL
jgi:hypothetical protein